jgi:hypothetical protein
MIYVLLLKDNKIYVGFTERPIGERFIEHFNYQGSKWTTKHRPLEVIHLLPGGKEEENQMTLRMMAAYGWWNVRGGNWCQVEMQTVPTALLEFQGYTLPTPLRRNQPQPSNSNPNACCRCGKESHSVSNACSRCGRESHSVSNCFARTHVNGQDLESSSEQGACYRCGRDSHIATDCYARTHITGFSL